MGDAFVVNNFNGSFGEAVKKWQWGQRSWDDMANALYARAPVGPRQSWT